MFYLKKIISATGLLCLLLAFDTQTAQAQVVPNPKPRLSAADSVLLTNTIADFISALEKKKDKKVRLMSFDSVVCLSCCPIDTNLKTRLPQDYMVPVGTFIDQSMASFATSPVCKAYHERGCAIRLYDFGRFEAVHKPEHILYEVWIPTYLPEEWTVGDKGLQHVLQFKKTGEEFKFYGFASVQ